MSTFLWLVFFLYKTHEKCLWKSFLEKVHSEILQFLHKMNSPSEVFYKKSFLKISQISKGKSKNKFAANSRKGQSKHIFLYI